MYYNNTNLGGKISMSNKFYWEPEHLNVKKVIGILVIIFIFICLVAFGIENYHKTPENQPIAQEDNINQSTIFYSDDNSISVELLNSYKLKKYESDYLLELRSHDDLNIFISKNPAIENKNLADLIEKEKNNYLSTFENTSNISESKSITVNENTVYTYSFHYLDPNVNTTFYLQVMWLQIGNDYYTFDIEFPLDKLSFFTNVSTSILYSFSVYN